MFRTPPIRSIAIAAAVATALGAATPTLAQQIEDRIVVTAPAVEYERDRFRLGEAESVSVTRIVSTADLDLRYEGDLDELHRRVAFAAELACDDAEVLIRDSLTADRECEREARRDAGRQIEAAVARDYRY